MSYETRKPNIKLVLPESWFNILITALTLNTKMVEYPNTATNADALINKLMKYSRPFFDDGNDEEHADIRFFPNEAGEMIWQLLIICGCFCDADEDFFSQLKENHIPKERKNESK